MMRIFRRTGFPCPCCGYLTLDQRSPGSWLICPVCFWEDDPVQHDDPSFEGGANRVSLEQARHNVATIGVSEERFRAVVRPPRDDERPRRS